MKIALLTTMLVAAVLATSSPAAAFVHHKYVATDTPIIDASAKGTPACGGVADTECDKCTATNATTGACTNNQYCWLYTNTNKSNPYASTCTTPW